MVSIFGIAKKGFGKAVKKYKQKKLQAVKLRVKNVLSLVKEIVTLNLLKELQKVWKQVKKQVMVICIIKNIKEINKHKEAIQKGEEAKKKFNVWKILKELIQLEIILLQLILLIHLKKGYDK